MRLVALCFSRNKSFSLNPFKWWIFRMEVCRNSILKSWNMNNLFHFWDARIEFQVLSQDCQLIFERYCFNKVTVSYMYAQQDKRTVFFKKTYHSTIATIQKVCPHILWQVVHQCLQFQYLTHLRDISFTLCCELCSLISLSIFLLKLLMLQMKKAINKIMLIFALPYLVFSTASVFDKEA